MKSCMLFVATTMTPFNDTERLVIELADALTNTTSNVSDELYASLRNQFSEE